MAKQLEIQIEEIAGSITPRSNEEWFKSIMKDEGKETRNSQFQGPKISKVPRMLGVIEVNKDCYDPLMVSIGPYHYGKPELREMENIKLMMARQYVQQSGEVVDYLYEKVAEVSNESRKYYAEGSTEGLDDKQFTQMMFLDGCFILQFIFCFLRHTENLRMNSHVAALVTRDLFLLENQLPFPVLESLMSLRFKKGDLDAGEDDDEENQEGEGMKLLKEFFKHIRAVPPRRESCRERISKFFRRRILPRSFISSSEDGRVTKKPIHLLELFRAQFVGREVISTNHSRTSWSSYHPVMELRRVGLHFKPSKTTLFTDVHFKSTVLAGRLQIPPLKIHDSTKSLLLNLVAYEACLGEFNELWVTSYICFMDSLIDHPEDVKELRSQGILLNTLGSDRQVAELFNEIANYLVPNPYAYIQAKRGIELHCRNTFKRWILHYKGPTCGVIFKYSFLFGIIISAIKAYVAVMPMQPLYGVCRLPDANVSQYP